MRLLLLAALALAAFARRARAQHDHDAHDAADPAARSPFSAGAMAVGVYTRAWPGPYRATISEGYLTQPMVFASWSNGPLAAYGTLNLEGATLRRGEITPGGYGEGYVDRRHPHTYLHEAMLGLRARCGDARVSLFAGKGFVPFGTDDPMVRPFVKYPVNHHLAQLLERAMVTVGAGWRGATLEYARFNGDEPESPTDWPNADRAFDSWAARATLRPLAALELSASLARVKSPEFAAGFGLDQRKESAAVRWVATAGVVRYAFAEYARSREFSDTRLAYTFDSWLAEALAALGGGWSLAARLERTTRPEEERTTSPFRTPRPMHDFNIIGRTRWTTATLLVRRDAGRWGGLRLQPFIEAGAHVPRATVRPTALDPVELYGGRTVWSLSAGVRLHVATMRPRFGRYADWN